MPSGLYQRQKFTEPPRTRSGLKGVIRCANLTYKPWKAYGRHHAMYVTIGYFATKEEAAKAYNLWALKIYGPKAYFNPIRPPSHD
jgi:hypothetical protein